MAACQAIGEDLAKIVSRKVRLTSLEHGLANATLVGPEINHFSDELRDAGERRKAGPPDVSRLRVVRDANVDPCFSSLSRGEPHAGVPSSKPELLVLLVILHGPEPPTVARHSLCSQACSIGAHASVVSRGRGKVPQDKRVLAACGGEGFEEIRAASTLLFPHPIPQNLAQLLEGGILRRVGIDVELGAVVKLLVLETHPWLLSRNEREKD